MADKSCTAAWKFQDYFKGRGNSQQQQSSGECSINEVSLACFLGSNFEIAQIRIRFQAVVLGINKFQLNTGWWRTDVRRNHPVTWGTSMKNKENTLMCHWTDDKTQFTACRKHRVCVTIKLWNILEVFLLHIEKSNIKLWSGVKTQKCCILIVTTYFTSIPVFIKNYKFSRSGSSPASWTI